MAHKGKKAGTLCFKVRYEGLKRLSDKAVLIYSHNGASDIIPVSQIYWDDVDSGIMYVSAWILEKKSIQYTKKGALWFTAYGCAVSATPEYKSIRHTPERVLPVESNEIEELKI